MILTTPKLVYGKNDTVNGVSYLLRSLSAGSSNATPAGNEWDQILAKGDLIHNYNKYSWGQDTAGFDASRRVLRGNSSASFWNATYSTYSHNTSNTYFYGFRPALEIINADTLSSDALKTVTYEMGANGILGSGSLTSATVVYAGTLTLPDMTAANGFNYTGAPQAGKILGWNNGSVFYPTGTKLSSLPSGTVLTAGYGAPTYALTVTAGTGGSVNTGAGGNYSEGAEINLTATPSANYTFSQWTSIGGGTFGSTTSAATTFMMPENAATITAIFTLFKAVNDITGVPTSGTVGTQIDLTGATVIPSDATSKTITWTVKDAGTTGVTGADLATGKFTPSAAGTLVLTATVANGLTESLNYSRDFTITVSAAPDTRRWFGRRRFKTE